MGVHPSERRKLLQANTLIQPEDLGILDSSVAGVGPDLFGVRTQTKPCVLVRALILRVLEKMYSICGLRVEIEREINRTDAHPR